MRSGKYSHGERVERKVTVDAMDFILRPAPRSPEYAPRPFPPSCLIGWQRAAKTDVAAGGPVHANDLGTANVDLADAASRHDVADCVLTDTTTGHHMNSSGGAEDERCEAFDSLERGGGTPRREYPPHAANDERLERLSEVGSAVECAVKRHRQIVGGGHQPQRALDVAATALSDRARTMPSAPNWRATSMSRRIRSNSLSE